MTKEPLKKLFVSNLASPFYLNVVNYFNSKDGEWHPVWYSKWAGSDKQREAVKLRREFLDYLQTNGSADWSEKNLKTVKITLYK